MYDEEDEEVFLGKSAGATRSTVSVDTASKIDREVRSIIDEAYATAKRLLEENRDKLDIMAETLLEYETIDRDQIDDIMAGATPREPKGWSDDDQPKGKSSKKTSIKGAAEEL